MVIFHSYVSLPEGKWIVNTGLLRYYTAGSHHADHHGYPKIP